MNQTTRTRPWLSVMALLLSLTIPVFMFAQGGGGEAKAGGGTGRPWRTAGSRGSSRAGSHRPDGLLGFAGDRRLAVSHGDSRQGRYRQRSAQQPG